MRYFLKGFAYKWAGLILILGQKDAAVIRVRRFFKARRLLEAILYFVSSNFQSIRFFVLNVSIFYFCTKIHILENSRALISKMTIVSFKFQPKILRYEIFFKNSKVFSF